MRKQLLIGTLIVAAIAGGFGIWLAFQGAKGPAVEEIVYQAPKGYLCYRAKQPPVIDGRLDDAAWQDAPWTDDFMDIEGEKKPKPRFRTRARMLWDDDYFYIAAELEEPHVWATFTKHDSYIFHEDNDFEVFLDPDGDNHLYAEFEINARNTGWDLLLTMPYRDGGKAIDSWEIPSLKTAVHVHGTLNDPSDTDRGWTVEMAFPWKVLGQLSSRKVPPTDGEQWRVNFSRVEWRHEVVEGKYRRVQGTKEDNWVWSPQGAINMHMPERWGHVQFTTAEPGQADFRPDPTGPARAVLHAVYCAQRDYRQQHGRWATTLEELGLARTGHSTLDGPPTLATTADLFQATVRVKRPDGTVQRLHIRQDSRVWSD